MYLEKIRNGLIGICVLAAAFLSAQAIQAATFTVTNTNDNGAGSLRQAILDANAAPDADVIQFDPGVFSTPQTITLTTEELYIDSNITINGPGAGLLSISGNDQLRNFLIRAIKSPITVSINNMTIKDGFTAGGPGIRVNAAGTDLRVTLIVDSVILLDNENNSGAPGGGIMIFGNGNLSVNDSIFRGNIGNGGGGISCGGGGGACLNVSITNTLFEANQGGSLGGAGVICCGNGTPETPIVMENVAFIRNVTGNNGSAVRLSSGPNTLFEFKNVTVAHNTSVIGAAMILQFGQFSFENSTIAYNKSTEPSDFRTIGILSQWGDSVLSFRNTIVAKNANVNGVEMDLDVQDRVFGSLNSLGYNIFGSLVGTTAVEGDTTGNQIGVDPGLYFVPQGAGSPLMTMALVPGSPAIDAGDPGNFLPTDPRGVARPVDGDGNGSALPDIGAFERTPADVLPLKPVFDFDGDARTDVSIFRPGADPAQWWFLRSSDQGTRGLQFGSASDVPVAADFTGDGRTDIAFWRPSTGEWFILRSEDDSFFAFPFGAAGDIPAPGDFDGDGKADPAVYRPSAGTWFVFRSSDSQVSVVPFGVATDKPIVADYDGDGIDDVGVYRAPDNQFWLLRSSLGVKAYQFGAAGDRTTVGDWTGDGKADVAFFRPSTSEWYVIRSEDDSFFAFPWGATGDIPSPGDFDGDGQTDPAVWRPSDNTWYIFGSTNGFQAVLFGATGDVPLPSSVSVN